MQNIHHWGVAVGIDQYPGLDADLLCARRDARAFEEWLKDPEGGNLPAENVELITEADLPEDCTTDAARPTTEIIYNAIQKAYRAADNARKTKASTWNATRLYLYFSGHGIAVNTEDTSLLTANVDTDNPGRHISCNALKDFFVNQRYFRELVIIADCCRDDFSRRLTSWSLTPWALNTPGVTAPTGAYLITATVFGRAAFEERDGPPAERRGYFTRCLLETLNSRLDPSVKTIDLNSFETRMMGLLASVRSQPQAPTDELKFWPIKHGLLNDLKFGVTGKPPVYLTTIHFPAATTHARLRGNEDPIEMAKNGTEGVFECRIPLGGYQIEYSVDGGASFQEVAERLTLVPGCNERKVGE